jgi:hypothetical protein
MTAKPKPPIKQKRLERFVAEVGRATARYLHGHERTCDGCQKPKSAAPIAVADSTLAIDNLGASTIIAVFTGIMAEAGVTHNSHRPIATIWLCPHCIGEGMAKMRLHYRIKNMVANMGH